MIRKNPLVQPIHTTVRGRARYSVQGLHRSVPLKLYLEWKLSNNNGISYVCANIVTGNTLIIFKPNDSPSEIASRIEGVVLEYKREMPENAAKGAGLRSQSQERKGPGTTSLTKNSPTRKLKGLIEKLGELIPRVEEQRVEDWHLMEADAVIASLNTSLASGLPSQLAGENLKKYGPNLLPESVPRSGLSIFIDQFKSLPVGLLGASAGLSVLTGGLVDAIVIMGVVIINAAIGYSTESRAERTVTSLKGLVRPFATVIRDATQKVVGGEELVLGDILVLKPGSYVAADARLIEANRLSVDESVLTGENMPVLKTITPIEIKAKDIPLAERVNMVYMGTLVTGGQGLAVVVATGRFTEMGKIQTLVGEARPPETPMERQLRQLGNQLVLIGGALCGAVFVISLLRGYGFFLTLKTSTALAVAAVPEGLPTIATTTLALGIGRMRRHNVLIRHLDAVETLGSIQTICLDKTGTLTLNKISVVVIYAGMRRIKIVEDKFVAVEEEYIDPIACDELLRLIHVSVLCNETEVGIEDGRCVLNGSATENALVHIGVMAGVDIMWLRKRYPTLNINYRSENRNYMSTVHTINLHGRLIALKGSPAEVLAMCEWHIKDGKRLPLTEEDRLKIEAENGWMCGEALRVLGVSYAIVNGEGEVRTREEGLTWLGLVGMADPIRAGTKGLIADFHRAGIDTVMITGDQSLVARTVGEELDLGRGEKLNVFDYTQLSKVNPEELKALLEKVHVFARVSPAQKLQIVQTLQKAGKVVAMTGDGINDGPALKAADIGIAMGHQGTDVAREVADVVLEDDNLETMIIAISHGRTIHSNIRKSVHFLLATNLSEIIVMFTSIALGIGQPLTAMQLLWINLVSDIFPGLALALEQPEPDVLSRPPRNPGEPIVRASDFKRITFESTAIATSTLGAYSYGLMRYGIGPRASTIAFTSLTAGELLHAISCRSERYSIFSKEKPPPNKHLNIALLGTFTLQAICMAMPWLRGTLGITPISMLDGLVVGSSALLPLLINEGTKEIGQRIQVAK